MATTIPRLPDVTNTQFLPRVKELLEIRENLRGDGMSGFVTYHALEDMGINIKATTQVSSEQPTKHTTGDSVAPASPYNLSVIGVGINSHLISWTNPSDSDLYYIEIYCAEVASGASAPAFVDAEVIAVVTSYGFIGEEMSITRADINSATDYYYWAAAVDWSGNRSAVVTVGNIKYTDSPTIDNLMSVLLGDDPSTYSASTTYTEGERISYTIDSKLRRYIRTDYDLGTSGHAPSAIMGDNYWDRVGILTEGEIDGDNVVGIDGHLIVDGSILANAIRGDAFGTLTISAGGITMSSGSDGITIGSGADLNISGGDLNISATGNFNMASGGSMELLAAGGHGITIDGSGLAITGAVTFASGSDDAIAGSGTNIMPAKYSTFFSGNQATIWNYGQCSVGISGTGVVGETPLYLAATASDAYAYLGASGSDMNITIPGGKKWIVSFYVYCNTASVGGQVYLYDGSSHIGPQYWNYTVSANTWERISFVWDLTSYSSKQELQLRIDNEGGSGCTMYFDGFMIEEQVGPLDTPSAYAAGVGSIFEHDSDRTTIDGGNIYAGSLMTVGNPSSRHVDVTSTEVQINNSGTTIAWADTYGFRSTIQPSVLKGLSSDITSFCGDASYHTITWSSEIYDQGGDMSSTTFTAPCTGRYLVTVNLRLLYNNSAYATLKVVTSNRSYYHALPWTSTNIISGHFSVIADMDTNDIMYATLLCNDAVDVSAGYSFMAVHLVA